MGVNVAGKQEPMHFPGIETLSKSRELGFYSLSELRVCCICGAELWIVTTSVKLLCM